MGNPTHGKDHEEGGLTKCKGEFRPRGNSSGLSRASTPKTRVCLPYCIMLSTYSSDITAGAIPDHLSLEKVNLELQLTVSCI